MFYYSRKENERINSIPKSKPGTFQLEKCMICYSVCTEKRFVNNIADHNFCSIFSSPMMIYTFHVASKTYKSICKR